MKKKLIAMLLAATMIFSLAGCGDKANNDDNGGSSAPTESTPAPDSNGGQDESTPAPADEVEKPSEITILVDGTVFTEPNARDKFIEKLEELIGIKVNVIQPDHDA